MNDAIVTQAQNQPAFPWQFPGLSIRDYFAANAMAALMADGRGTNADVAGWSYKMADAMLKARADGCAA